MASPPLGAATSGPPTSGLGKLTSSIEELSLKKQLPLREQERKPLLHYSTQKSTPLSTPHGTQYSGPLSLQYTSPLHKPVQLFNQSDIAALRNAANNTGSPYPYAGTGLSYVPPSGKQATLKESPVSGRRLSEGSHSPQSQPDSHERGERRTSPTKTSDPYSRPLSSKDLANISAQYQKSLRRLPGGVTIRTVASPDSAKGHATLQTNSFMLPHSVLRSDKHSHSSNSQNTHRVSKRSEQSPGGNSRALSDATTSTSSVNGAESGTSTPTNDSPASVGKEACKALIEIGSQVSQAAGRVCTENSDNVASASRTSLSSHSPSQGTDRPPTGLGRPIVTLLRPASRASATGSVSSTQNDSPSKVRNLNYTPTKPYDQVQEAGSESRLPSPPPSPPPGRAISPTRSDKSKQSIQFYRKASKSQERIHEHGVRLKGDGAPSRASQAGESDHKLLQSASGTSEACEGEGSESGVPSGERLPGDGEASVEDWDPDDVSDHGDGDDLDDLEGDFTDTDNDSDSYSITSSLSKPSLASHSRLGRQSATPCRPLSTPSERRQLRSRSASSDVPVYSPLTPSLFSNIPPTINFVAEGEKVEKMPWEIRKLLKWRLSPITPNVVKAALSRIGFRITKRNHDWLGCFGKHMKSQAFKSIRDYQKLNHFPGSFQLGRKDRLWRNLSKMQVHFGKKEYGFFPQTFVLPYDLKLLKRAWEDGGCKQKWIIKPPASARGIGIRVIHKWTQIPRKRPVIVQRYLARPFLINDSKFDMRVYVYVSSCDPLRIYIYEDGLARFASSKYSSSMKNLSNKFMHLTNYSINKKNDEYQSNSDETVCQGHKWSLKALWSYLRKQGVNSGAVWDSVKDLIVKTVICAESAMNSMIKANVRSRYSVHELFGFDILLDENLRPWILEVNISPSLHSNSQLDVNIKGNMVKDMFNIAGFRIPNKQDVTPSGSSSNTDLSSYIPSNEYCMDKRQFCGQLAPDERAKHAYYCQRHMDEHALQTILDTLTPDDIRLLTESIDEDSRKGGFQRVFPTPSTHRYLRFFEQARYYNLLLDCWVQRYNRLEARGIGMLQSFCREGIHFDLATDNPNHQWSPPSASVLTFRESRMTSAPAAKPPKDTDTDIKTRILQQHFSGPSQFSRVSTMRRSKVGSSVVSVVTRPAPHSTPPSPSPLKEPSPTGKPPRPPGSITDTHR